MTTDPVVIDLPPGKQLESWNALIDLHEDVPRGWSLVGGQMVFLWCLERGGGPARPTDDVDAVLDVRAHPQILHEVTQALVARGFRSDGTTRSGHQHRWVRGGAVIDVLIPRHLGNKPRLGVGGATTVETPGAQKVLNRTQSRKIVVDGRAGAILRPTLLGALIAKASARTVTLDRRRDRHLVDFAVLAMLLRPSDIADDLPLDRRERRRLLSMIGDMRVHPLVWLEMDGVQQALSRLELATSAGSA